MYRVAILESEYWHVVAQLATAKKFDNIEIVAMSGDGEFSRKTSVENGIKLYPDYKTLLDKEKGLDFVYVFGKYKQTPSVYEYCIDQGLPFIGDKPCCQYAEQLEPVIEKLKKTGLKHCITLKRRYAQVVEYYKDLVRERAKTGSVHLVLRYITGSPRRYEDRFLGWANDPKVAGGGTLLNLGVHYTDLVNYLTEDDIVDAHGVLNCNVWNVGHDDYAAMVLKTKRGNTAVVEVGYTKSGYPTEDFIFSGKNFYINASAAQKIQYFALKEGGNPNGELIEEKDFPDHQFYDKCLQSMLDCLEGKGEPVATVEDAYKAMKPITKVYRDNGFLK
jgi:predicted dehydrogenase